jgi:hypothetical protein
VSEGKIEIKIGHVQFSAEGEQAWVSDQLDKMLKHAESLAKIAPPPQANEPQNGGTTDHTPMVPDSEIAQKPLATFLKEKNATTAQVTKFLATSVWLESKGKSRMTTSDVTAALRSSNQSKLGNPADCLNQNVKKGFCEKEGKEYYVTQEGKDSL